MAEAASATVEYLTGNLAFLAGGLAVDDLTGAFVKSVTTSGLATVQLANGTETTVQLDYLDQDAVDGRVALGLEQHAQAHTQPALAQSTYAIYQFNAGLTIEDQNSSVWNALTVDTTAANVTRVNADGVITVGSDRAFFTLAAGTYQIVATIAVDGNFANNNVTNAGVRVTSSDGMTIFDEVPIADYVRGNNLLESESYTAILTINLASDTDIRIRSKVADSQGTANTDLITAAGGRLIITRFGAAAIGGQSSPASASAQGRGVQGLTVFQWSTTVPTLTTAIYSDSLGWGGLGDWQVAIGADPGGGAVLYRAALNASYATDTATWSVSTPVIDQVTEGFNIRYSANGEGEGTDVYDQFTHRFTSIREPGGTWGPWLRIGNERAATLLTTITNSFNTNMTRAVDIDLARFAFLVFRVANADNNGTFHRLQEARIDTDLIGPLQASNGDGENWLNRLELSFTPSGATIIRGYDDLQFTLHGIYGFHIEVHLRRGAAAPELTRTISSLAFNARNGGHSQNVRLEILGE